MDFLRTFSQAIAFVPALVNSIENLFRHRDRGGEKKTLHCHSCQPALSVRSAVANRQIVDQAVFKDGLGKVIDGAVESLNASVLARVK
jgi:hypothetical protein